MYVLQKNFLFGSACQKRRSEIEYTTFTLLHTSPFFHICVIGQKKHTTCQLLLVLLQTVTTYLEVKRGHDFLLQSFCICRISRLPMIWTPPHCTYSVGFIATTAFRENEREAICSLPRTPGAEICFWCQKKRQKSGSWGDLGVTILSKCSQ